MLLLVLALLNCNKELNSAPIVFQNSIDNKEGKGHNLVISLDSFDDLEEQSNVILCLGFLNM